MVARFNLIMSINEIVIHDFPEADLYVKSKDRLECRDEVATLAGSCFASALGRTGYAASWADRDEVTALPRATGAVLQAQAAPWSQAGAP